MSPLPVVSVVIPLYDGRPFIGDAIQRVRSQTYPAIEIVVVDDGSTDGAVEAVCARSPGQPIVVVRRDHAGVTGARSAGVRASSGEFVAFLDQDDWWLPSTVEKQVALLQTDAEVGFVHTGSVHYDQAAHSFVGRLNPSDAPHELTEDVTTAC